MNLRNTLGTSKRVKGGEQQWQNKFARHVAVLLSMKAIGRKEQCTAVSPAPQDLGSVNVVAALSLKSKNSKT